MPEDFISKVIEIKGMTCTSCEMRIEKKLKKMKGIKAIKAVYTDSKINVTFDKNSVSLDRIIDAVEELDYKVLLVYSGSERKTS